MTWMNKMLLTGIAAGAAAMTAAAVSVMRYAEHTLPELSASSETVYEAQAAELPVTAPAPTVSSAELPDLETLPETGYLLKLHGDVLSVYEEGIREPIAEYDLPADWLPDYDRILLEYGFRISGTDELRELVEDYLS